MRGNELSLGIPTIVAAFRVAAGTSAETSARRRRDLFLQAAPAVCRREKATSLKEAQKTGGEKKDEACSLWC